MIGNGWGCNFVGIAVIIVMLYACRFALKRILSLPIKWSVRVWRR